MHIDIDIHIYIYISSISISLVAIKMNISFSQGTPREDIPNIAVQRIATWIHALIGEPWCKRGRKLSSKIKLFVPCTLNSGIH